MRNETDAWLAGQKTGGQELIGGLDCTVHRNFFGSQVVYIIFFLGAQYNPRGLGSRISLSEFLPVEGRDYCVVIVTVSKQCDSFG